MICLRPMAHAYSSQPIFLEGELIFSELIWSLTTIFPRREKPTFTELDAQGGSEPRVSPLILFVTMRRTEQG